MVGFFFCVFCTSTIVFGCHCFADVLFAWVLNIHPPAWNLDPWIPAIPLGVNFMPQACTTSPFPPKPVAMAAFLDPSLPHHHRQFALHLQPRQAQRLNSTLNRLPDTATSTITLSRCLHRRERWVYIQLFGLDFVTETDRLLLVVSLILIHKLTPYQQPLAATTLATATSLPPRRQLPSQHGPVRCLRHA